MQQIVKTEYSSTKVKHIDVPLGMSLDAILDEAYKELEDVYTPLQMVSVKRLTFVTVDGVRIPRKAFKTTFPKAGAHIHVHRRVAGGGGGGGTKNIITGVLMVVAAVAISYFSFGTLTAPSMAALSASGIGIGGMAVAAGSSLLLAAGASLALSGLFAQPTPSMGLSDLGLDAGATSSAYSITGVENTLRPNETVPVIFGTHRVTPPLGARNWTEWEGDTQYFHMLVVWGQYDLDVEDIRIGETPISYYKEVEINTVVSTGNNLKLFPKSRYEQSVGAELSNAAGWVSRVVGTAEDISLEIQFSGLFKINESNSNVEGASVTFEINYREYNTEEWKKDFFIATEDIQDFEGKIYAPNAFSDEGTLYTPTSGRNNIKIYTDADGNITAGENITGIYEIYPTKDQRISGCEVTITQEKKEVTQGFITRLTPTGYAIISVTSGMITDNGNFTVYNDDREFVMHTLRKNDLPLARYEVRIRRTTSDTDSQYIYDKASWAVMRAITNKPAFNTRVPVLCSEIRIKATEQLSSFVSNLNGLCHSKAPDWNGTEWEYRRTKNPASLARWLLTSDSVLYEPYQITSVDDVDFVAAHEWAESKGYTFNYIADTQVLLWERFMQILSPARCTPTIDNNGAWGIIIDQAGKEARQMFTARNSWGMSVSKAFTDLPHALRVSWIDENDDYAQKENYICADGYTMDVLAEPNKKLAIDIRAYDYPGVTTWESIVRNVWNHLAKLQHRPINVTLNTDWEYIAVRRGDVVEVAHSTLLNTYGEGKIIAFVYEDEDTGEEIIWDNPAEDAPVNVDGEPLIPIGIKLDEQFIFDMPDIRYGVKIRYNSGKVGTFELDNPYSETVVYDTLYFKYPLPTSAVPKFSNLCFVGDFDKSAYNQYIYAGSNFSENHIAEMSLVPYAQPIIENTTESGVVPPYVPPIILDQVQGQKLPTPTILALKSDESVLISSPNGGTMPTIKAWVSQSASGFDGSKVYYQISAQKNGLSTSEVASGNQGENTVSITNVIEKTLYTIRVRAVDMVTGITSNWSSPLTHEVVGRTTTPPPPSAVYMNGNVVEIQQTNRPLDVVGHVVTIAMDATDSIEMGVVVTNPYTTNGMFDISDYVGRARRVFVETIDELGLKSEPISIIINLGDIIPDNIVLVISEFNKVWDGEIHNGFITIENKLSAGLNEYLFPESDDAFLFPVLDDDFLFPSLTGSNLQYTYSVYISPSYVGGSIIIEPHIFSGRVQKIEYRIYQDSYLFPTDDKSFLFPVDDNGYLFPKDSPTEWVIMPDKLLISESFTIEIRVTTINTELTIFDDIVTIIDVEDKELILQDIDILADGTTRIPIPQKEFREITNIQGTLQYIEGDTGLSLEFVRGSEIYEDGFLTQGTLLRILDANKQLTSGNADIVVKGY